MGQAVQHRRHRRFLESGIGLLEGYKILVPGGPPRGRLNVQGDPISFEQEKENGLIGRTGLCGPFFQFLHFLFKAYWVTR